MSTNDKSGIVYVLINPAMPDWVKIGKTTKPQAEERADELFNTSVPLPFSVAHAFKTDNTKKLEDKLHEHFAKVKAPRREFFETDPDEVARVVERWCLDAVCAERIDPSEVETEEVPKDAREAADRKQKKADARRKNTDLCELGIQVGDELSFPDTDEKAEVIACKGKSIRFRGVPNTPSGAANIIRKEMGKYTPVSGMVYWMHRDGKTIYELRKEKDAENEEE